MAIFGKNDGGFMDVIRCDETDYLVWKWHPQGTTSQTSQRANAIRWGSSLRVRDGSAAVFVYSGADGKPQEYIEGPYDKVIETENFPVLATLIGTLYQGGSPFQAEIYFINKANTIQIPFGVGPINSFDGRHRDIAVPVAVRGSMNFRIEDVDQFIKCHSLSEITTEALKEKVRDFISGRVRSVVSTAAKDNNIPLIQIESRIPDVEAVLESDIRDKLHNEYGVELSSINISAIEINKTSAEYKKLEKLSQGKTAMFAKGVVTAIGDIKSQIAAEKKLDDAEKGEAPTVTEKVSGAIGGLFNKKDKVVPPPIPTAGYYLAVDGKQKGPYDISKFKDMLSKGTFDKDSLVWKEGMENWIRAEDVADIASIFEEPTSPPPIPM